MCPCLSDHQFIISFHLSWNLRNTSTSAPSVSPLRKMKKRRCSFVNLLPFIFFVHAPTHSCTLAMHALETQMACWFTFRLQSPCFESRVGRRFSTTWSKVLGNCSHLRNSEVSCISPSVNRIQKVEVQRFSVCLVLAYIRFLSLWSFFYSFFHSHSFSRKAFFFKVNIFCLFVEFITNRLFSVSKL